MSIPRRIARVGDVHICPAHGRNYIIEGSQSEIDHRGIARLGDKCACGCVIVEASASFHLDKRGIAYEGSKTSCGGVIAECKGSAFLLA